MNLTPRQFGILQLIRDFRIVHGYSPTMHEIASELGISKVTVFEHIETLIKKGALKREPNKARSLSISDDVLVPDETHSLIFPLVGKIAAGYPIEKYPQTDQVNLVDLFGPRIGQQGGTFALRVEGDPMKGEGIIDGDYVIIERRETASDGERVVALLPNGETTLKTFYHHADGRIRLQPANPDFQPIIVDNCSIQGVVLGVMRRY